MPRRCVVGSDWSGFWWTCWNRWAGERRHWGEVYVRSLLLDGERKSIEPLATRLPEGNVQAMQQFIGQSPWECNPVWERLGKRMTAELEPPGSPNRACTR